MSSFGHLIQDAKNIIKAFRLISLSHIGHEGNSVFVAHNFARHALHVLAHFS